MRNKPGKGNKKHKLYIIMAFFLGALLIIFSTKVIKLTSTDQFCMSCHVHPHAEESWRLSTHYDNRSGIVVHCVQCHLPPPGTLHYLTAKAVTGARDVYGMIFKDTDNINWEAKRQLPQAVKHTFEESCKSCHQNLFPRQLSPEGMDAHLYYSNNQERLNCLNCHLHVGHYSEVAHEPMVDFGRQLVADIIYESSATVTSFDRFSETIEGTPVSFDMLPVPGGVFEIGSPEREPGRSANEGPVRQVEVSSFFMSEVEVTWDLYMAFFRETMSEGRQDAGAFAQAMDEVQTADAISGPTPPWGNPDQGWGFGSRPAITMTYHAAETFCRWLSLKTGKNYRLPTEAEWEYAARGGTETPYFFEGNPRNFTTTRLWNRIFGADTTNINTYIIYEANSRLRTQPPDSVRPNPFGLKNMMGNVWEFVSDFYAEDAYAQYPADAVIKDPRGPASGTERVIRGGAFHSDAYDVRSATRSHTQHDAWMVTDPQIPKSIWWYSDSYDVGFRVVLDWPME
jgi:formylglycine-generating enzyme